MALDYKLLIWRTLSKETEGDAVACSLLERGLTRVSVDRGPRFVLSLIAPLSQPGRDRGSTRDMHRCMAYCSSAEHIDGCAQPAASPLSAAAQCTQHTHVSLRRGSGGGGGRQRMRQLHGPAAQARNGRVALAPQPSLRSRS